jgi:hypothetical protein
MSLQKNSKIFVTGHRGVVGRDGMVKLAGFQAYDDNE